MSSDSPTNTGSLLVIDTDTETVEMCARWAQARQWRFTSLTSPWDSVLPAETTRPSLALVDSTFSRSKSLDTIERLHSVSPDLSIIALTAPGDMGALRDAMSAGASDYIEKPVIDSALDQAVEQARSRGSVTRRAQGSSGMDASQETQTEPDEQELNQTLRSALNATADGIFAVGLSGEIYYWNERFSKMWNIPIQAMRAGDETRILEAMIQRVIDGKALASKYHEAHGSDQIERFTIELKDGQVFERRSEPMWRDGERIGRVYSYRNITDRLEAEKTLGRREKILQAVAFCARNLIMESDWNTNISYILEWLGGEIGLTDVCVLRDPMESKNLGEPFLKSQWSALRKTINWDPLWGELLDRWGEIMRNGKEIAGPVEELPGEEKALLGDAGARSILAFPIVVRAKWWGAMIFIDRQNPRPWPEGEIHALRIAALSLGGAIQRSEAADRIRRNLELLKTLINTIPYPVFHIDRNGVFETCNQAFADQVFGMRFERIIGQSPESLKRAAPEELYRLMNEFKSETYTTQMIKTSELTITCADKVERTFLFSQTHYRDMNRMIAGRVGVMVDMTERRWAEDALRKSRDELEIRVQKRTTELRESEKRFRNLVEGSSDLIWECDQWGRIIYCGPRAEDILGINPGDLEGQEIKNLIGPGTSQRTRRHGEIDFARNRPIRRLVVEFKFGDYPEVWLETSAMPAFNSQGSFTGYQAVSRDITERLAAEAEAARRREQLIQADKMISLGILVSGVAHEINNPNNFIMMNSALLEKAWSEAAPILERRMEEEGDFTLAGLPYSMMREQIPELFAGLKEGAERITRIVKDLKDYARKEPDDQRREIDVNEVIRAALALMNNLIKKRAPRLIRESAPELPKIMGNFQRLEQVVINLIQNACQALPDTDRLVMIRTYQPAGENGVMIEARDEGIGIQPEHIKRLTDPFFTTKRDEGGTGLGLSISAGIIKEHGGRIEFESEPGKGTTVRIFLPATNSGCGDLAEDEFS